MSKKEVKPEAAEPYTETATSDPRCGNHITAYSEKTSLGGPIPVVMGSAPMACKMKLSSKILEESGLRANDQVELLAGDGVIIIKKIGEPKPGFIIPPPTKNRLMADLMQFTREREAEMKEAREQPYRDEPDPEAAGELNEEQISQEEL